MNLHSFRYILRYRIKYFENHAINKSLKISNMNFIILFISVLCLKDLTVTIPEAVASGDTVTLHCNYDLQMVSYTNLLLIL